MFSGMMYQVTSGPMPHIVIVVFEVEDDPPPEKETSGLTATASKTCAARMRFSESAPPMANPPSADAPEIVIVLPPPSSDADMNPNPRSGRRKNPTCRLAV